MSQTENIYNRGCRVWLPDKELVWSSGTVVSYSPGTSIVVKDSNGKKRSIALTEDKKGLPPLRNPEILTMENNLTTMSYLHEPAVLHSLYQRFSHNNNIYTYCGIVLVAINPYCDVPLYGNEMIWAYKGQQIGQLDPHIYAISEDAYSEMKTLGRNQSIIVSGESGAGKTVSAKYAMRYFATVAGNEQETAIERRILSTNPIMEALGNAKTIRNDNSSRFGKYVELEFDKSQNIIGAHICTYLLEKSRVVYQTLNERNYHIFYHLCSVRDIPEMKHLHLRHPDKFKFTNQGRAPLIDNVNDSEMFYEMSESMFNMGISEEQQLFLYSVIAGLLHMGNIQIKEEKNDSCSIDKTSEALILSSKLMGLDPVELEKWLCHKKLKTRNETVVMTLRVGDAMAGLDALVKHVYASLFLWIVRLLNNSLTTGNNEADNFIGILDIYGFEMFEENSFEQFCINYANEKLQQQFNQHVFKLEQNEYIKEEITWSFIDFYDNQPCIDLIEKKMGIIDLLDEQCRMNRGTDEHWVQILYKEHTESHHFERPKTGLEKFIIVHYADRVSYTCHGFIAKNLDAVNDTHITLLQSSSLEMASEVFQESTSGTITSPKKLPRKLTRRTTTSTMLKSRTVGAQFKASLNLLMDALTNTVPHFIRCIKPNDEKEPFGFVHARVVQQLRACGVIETVRISAAGYPSRWSYEDFISRYSLLVHSSKICPGSLMKNCTTVLHAVVSDTDKYQFGKTKIFFRAGQVAYFEKLRSGRLFSACVKMQAHVRGFLAYRRYQRIKMATLRIQCHVRRVIARRYVQFLRETRAVISIQRHARGFIQLRKYTRLQVTTLYLQSAYRGNVARKEYLKVKYDVNARLIQKHIRGWLARCAYKQHVKKIIQIQSCVRRHLAKKKLKALKVEARSIGHFKKLNVKLEKRIFDLQMKGKNMECEKKAMLAETEDKVEELVDVKELLNKQTKTTRNLSKELDNTSEELKDVRKGYLELKLELAKRNREDGELEVLKKRIVVLEGDLSEAKETVETERTKNDERYIGLENSLRGEIASEREHHQKMLIENSNLQRQLQEMQELSHERWQDSSDDRDDASSVLSDPPPDSGILSPSMSHTPDQTLKYKLIELEQIRTKLSADLMVANKEKRYRDKDVQVSAVVKEAPAQCTVVTSVASTQSIKKEISDATTQSSRATHTISTQHHPSLRDISTTTTISSLLADDTVEISEDSAIEIEEEVRYAESGVQHVPDTLSQHVQSAVATDNRTIQVELSDDKIEILIEELNEMKREKIEIEAMLSFFYIPVQYNEVNEHTDFFKNYLNNLITSNSQESRCIALHPLNDKTLSTVISESYLTAANNSPADLRRGDTIENDEDTFSSFESEYTGGLQDELRLKLDLAYKTIAELKDKEDAPTHIVVNGGERIYPVDENERKRLEEIIVENVQLKEDLDRTTDELMDAIDELAFVRTKYEQMEGRLSSAKDALMKDISNTRNPRQAQDRIRSHMDQLRVVLFSDVAKFNKSKVRSAEDALLQNKVETLAGENIKLLDEITALQNAMPNSFITDTEAPKKLVRQDTHSARQKKQDFKGMLICKKEDDNKLVKRLITQLKTEHVTGAGCMSGITAHIMYMCVRYADHCNDEGRIQELLTAMITGVTSVTRKRSKDPIISTFWLSNCLVLLHDLTQFSGEEPYHSRITVGMQEFALKNYDLSDYRNLLSDQCVNIFHTIVKSIQDDIQSLLVSGMLEHDSIPGMNSSFSAGRSRSDRNCDTITIINKLQFYLQLMWSQNVHESIVKQLVRQILYFINACLLNNLLLRKDLCHWSKGIQIRYNLSQVEQWVREQNLDLDESGVLTSLAEIRQASQLLQMNKGSNENAAAICDTCYALNTLQIQKLLTMYSPSSEFEERVPQSVLKYILAYRPIVPGVKLMMDPNKFNIVNFAFEPKDVDFTMVNVPAGLRLSFLERY